MTVLPSDAEALVIAGALDRRLFDVTALISAGYDEAHVSDLPLIVHSAPAPELAKASAGNAQAATATADRLAALSSPSAPSRALESINARSVRIAAGDLGTFWGTLNPGGGSDTARAAVMPRISLDAKVKAVLDRSTAQVNAPSAWQAGYEGTGVKVAVLDTGADANHPDLAGRISKAENFSPSAGTNDVFGHGTHVAATVAGTGAASDGRRRGVAPKADLLIGKVLGDDGYGSLSSVIDGMEWAAGQNAKVVNMSLGADIPTDGTDPLSQAVNSLTASTGTLFVVAAGNTGHNGLSSINAPGAADSALTVGAVDRDDTLAPFSSQGPRLGDGAAKPDVTAPGVGIVAARAAGTTMGNPVDDHYTAASGTSMATPHVAGAAALLAQRNPGWTGQQIKDALVSTARIVSGTKTSGQGGGRIDLSTAMGPVTATGTIAFKPFNTGDQDNKPQTATIRYTNHQNQPLTLKLDLRLTTDNGRPLADGVAGLGATTVQVAPGATAEVPVRIEPAKAERGTYLGHVTATTPDGTKVTHTTVSLAVSGPKHRVTVVVRDRQGKVKPGFLAMVWGGAAGFRPYTDPNAGVLELEEGTYNVSSGFGVVTDDGEEQIDLIAPEVKVTKDMTVTLDASDVTEVKVRTPRPAEQRGTLSTLAYREIDGYGLLQGHMMFDFVRRLYVSRAAPVTDGTFEYNSRWQLVAEDLTLKVDGSPLRLNPYYHFDSLPFDDKGERLSAVSAGTTEAPDYRHSRGKVAVIRETRSTDEHLGLARSAAAAGAKALIVVRPDWDIAWQPWRPDGERTAIPSVRLSLKDGTALLERMKKGHTTLEFSGTVRSPYLYDVMQTARGSIPKELVHTVSDKESALVRNTYTRTGASSWASEQRFGWRPYQLTAWDQHQRIVPIGTERLEYVTGGDTLWSQTVNHNVVPPSILPLEVGMKNAPRTYRPGEQVSERWFGAPVRPSLPRGATQPSVRNGDTLSVFIPEFTDSTPGHWSIAEVPLDDGGVGLPSGRQAAASALADTTSAVLYRDGKRISEAPYAWGNFRVPAGKAEYRLDLATGRTSDNWHFATGTRTSWTFRSDTTTDSTLLPLLQVDYDVPVDALNAVSSKRRHDLGFSVRMQDAMAAPRGVSLQVETSYDDGKTWAKASTSRKGGKFTASVERPDRVRGDAYVTLRVTAKDSAGNKVQQTVDRAYLHRGGR
ncbi:S8 family serine peptidase [Streptomyces sp. NPDC059949]|uniref:S8 family serine peptidase n=1 Tax=Streptomyces sp. NPDC059949 TaxID=3347013 RepID=UPI003647C5F7